MTYAFMTIHGSVRTKCIRGRYFTCSPQETRVRVYYYTDMVIECTAVVIDLMLFDERKMRLGEFPFLLA